ncbi:unnamed protein product [Urochloa decumbens]|uniref:NAD-dependent epimerase/dehydratase domain-containing protein n=1 Tax=Urochloa decumbens TaxID=240449 RepID=A0ABC8YMR4_9POAL
MASAETVMVTGASGFIGSTLVRRLLDRGYDVHAGVLNPDDKAETDHLHALAAGAGEGRRLSVFRCDLLDGAALLDAARGCSGVFHLASPCTIDPVSDPQNQLTVPAVEGTVNVLRAAKEAGGVRRVVVTSSNAAIMPSPGWAAGEVPDERCWTDIDYCEKNGLWYSVSKTLAEKAAWSMSVLLRLLQGCTAEYKDIFIGAVHVEDVALAHILVFENPSASGRHLCIESISHWSDLAAKVAELYPNYKVPKQTQPI